jgi:hypothetical protein
VSAEQDVPDVDVTGGDEPTSTATEADAIETPATPKPKRDLLGRVRQGAKRQ